ncbi:hypothetical protein CO046_02530 [Candidatus Peregrinibacteria bacterium CG_4_9_14_0_2_um_filter_53_11]|nr:MAG: hypothetical protein CO046_02530 [Candidatus Peregrinibacteria bacterium CG_4_9_14_0_2_um_filter_53_11]
METKTTGRLLAGLRIVMGFTFLWAFLDKTFGLGFSTAAEKSWLAGSSPTAGFLQNATTGPLASFYQGLAGSGLVDWLYMIGLLCLGVALILGVGLKVAGYAGGLLVLLMWSSLLPPKNNPIVDDHIAYLFVLLLLPRLNAGDTWGLGGWWKRTELVRKHGWLA